MHFGKLWGERRDLFRRIDRDHAKSALDQRPDTNPLIFGINAFSSILPAQFRRYRCRYGDLAVYRTIRPALGIVARRYDGAWQRLRSSKCYSDNSKDLSVAAWCAQVRSASTIHFAPLSPIS